MPRHQNGWDWEALGRCSLRETRRVLGDRPEAEDAAQEALARAWQHRGRCRDGARPEAWVRQIARNEALRMAERAPSEPAGTWNEDEHGGPIGLPLDVDALAGRVDLLRSIRRLAAGDRQLLYLRYVVDLTQPEVANRTGVAEGTAKVRLHRARQRLRSTMEEDPDPERGP